MSERPPEPATESLAEQVRRLVDREVAAARESRQAEAAVLGREAILLIGASALAAAGVVLAAFGWNRLRARGRS